MYLFFILCRKIKKINKFNILKKIINALGITTLDLSDLISPET